MSTETIGNLHYGTSGPRTVFSVITGQPPPSPPSLVVILPARCHVSREWVLRSALDYVIAELPRIPEGVAALGMTDIAGGVDEDYLVAAQAVAGLGLVINAFARRPAAWIAERLQREGALIASGIMIGYAGI